MFSVATSSRSTLRTALRGARASSISIASTRYSSTMHDNDPEVLEREKFRNLSKVQGKYSPHENAPGWNEKLASASEAAVKADRSTGTAKEMVSDTVEFMRARDELNGENPQATSASYCRDEVRGPLKGVGKEEVTIEQDTVVLNAEGTNRVVKGSKKEVKITSGEKVKANRKEA